MLGHLWMNFNVNWPKYFLNYEICEKREKVVAVFCLFRS